MTIHTEKRETLSLERERPGREARPLYLCMCASTGARRRLANFEYPAAPALLVPREREHIPDGGDCSFMIQLCIGPGRLLGTSVATTAAEALQRRRAVRAICAPTSGALPNAEYRGIKRRPGRERGELGLTRRAVNLVWISGVCRLSEMGRGKDKMSCMKIV